MSLATARKKIASARRLLSEGLRELALHDEKPLPIEDEPEFTVSEFEMAASRRRLRAKGIAV